MRIGTSVSIDVLRVGYIAIFAVAAAACFVGVARAERIDDDEIRRGLSGLLLLNGTWAGAHVGRLVGPTPTVKIIFYILGLSVGLGSVFAWLYFCSAYTSRSYHRTPAYRRLALVIFLVVVGIKLTNPIHGIYFSTIYKTTPFPHLVIQLGAAHWIVTGLAYALSAVGFYMLFELFTDIDYDTSVLGFLVALTGLPVVLDLIGYLSPGVIITLNYEPLGVAVFGLGVLYVTETTFLAVPRIGRQQLIDSLEEIILFLGTDDRVLDSNQTAQEHLSGLQDAVGDPIAEIIPALADPAAVDGEVIKIEQTDAATSEYYLVRLTPLTAGDKTLGWAVILTDVTDVERQRRELQRQNEQLDGFAAAVAHELRNSLTIIGGKLDLLTSMIQTGDNTEALETIETVTEYTHEMERVVGDLTRLARLSQQVTDPPSRQFPTVIEESWKQTDFTENLDIQTVGTGSFEVDERRLVEILRNVGQIAQHTAATSVAVELRESDLRIAFDGHGLRTDDPEAVFEYGTAVPDSETGMFFANIQALARAHGWTVELTPDVDSGFELMFANIH